MELILKHIRGAVLSEGERRTLEEWTAESVDNRAMLESFEDKTWLEQRLKEIDAVPSSRMWNSIRERIGVVEEKEVQVPRRLPMLKWTGVAAALVLVLAGFPWLRHHLSPVTEAKTVGLASLLEMDMPGHWESRQSLTNGQRQVTDSTGHARPFSLTLPDSSKVKLSYGSSLRYVAGLDGHIREVFLSGQASFDVAQDKDRPFIVHTISGDVRVLGTYFNVMAYPGEPAAITLIRGAVQVVRGSTTRLLKPSEQAVLGETELMRVSTLSNAEGSLAWAEKDPCFNFTNTDLNTVIRQLARWYQVKVSNPDRVWGVGITGIIKLGDSLEANLALIGRTETGFARLERKGDTIFIHNH